jgi:hypothetical protein
MSEAAIGIKATFVKESFIRTADHNYLIGRHALQRDLVTDGMWLVAHAVEKYLKATLLLNARSVKAHSHGVVSLYNDFRDVSGNFVPDTFKEVRNATSGTVTGTCTLSDFIVRLGRLGAPENRYQLVGYDFTLRDIIRVDELVYWLRRTCRHPEQDEKLSDPYFWEVDPSLPIERAMNARDSTLAEMLLEGNLIWNMVATRGEVRRTAVKSSISVQQSALMILLEDLERLPSDLRSRTADEVLVWISENVRMSKPIEAALKQAAKKLLDGGAAPEHSAT